jgi:formyltetrahydrofolate deformylase
MSAYILTLSCPDRPGIVHAVSGFLLERGGNIEEAAQYNDHGTGLFFMRVRFACGQLTPRRPARAAEALRRGLPDGLEAARAAQPVKTVILVSKEGHCLNDLLFRWKSGLLPVDIRAIVSNHRDFYQLAASYNVPFHHIPVTAATKAQAEAKQYEIIEIRGRGTGGAGALHADPVGRPVPQAVGPRDQHPPQLPAQLQGRQALLPGARPRREADRRHRALRDGRPGRRPDHRAGRRPRGPHRHGRRPHGPGRDTESQVLARAVKWHSEHRVLMNGHKTVIFK